MSEDLLLLLSLGNQDKRRGLLQCCVCTERHDMYCQMISASIYQSAGLRRHYGLCLSCCYADDVV